MGGGTYWRRYGAYVIRALTALISIQKLINCAILERGAARRVVLYQIITGKLKIDDIFTLSLLTNTHEFWSTSLRTQWCVPFITLWPHQPASILLLTGSALNSKIPSTPFLLPRPLTHKLSDWVSMKEFLWWKIKAFPLGDHFITSWNLFSWLCSDIVRRKLMLVKIAGGERL